MVLSAIAILAVLVADMHESTTTAYLLAISGRDELRAEYLARSGLNLTRLLVSREPQIRLVIAPIYQMAMGRQPPQLPVWVFANDALQPFCAYERAKKTGRATGIDLTRSQGLKGMPGTCVLRATSENSKINVNLPLSLAGDQARQSIAIQLYSLMGGYQSPSPYDPLFSARDADGLFTSRLDVLSAIIDWWDFDTQRTVYDPTTRAVTRLGAEEDVYAGFRDPYRPKNAPFDSIEELRLVRGVGDDFFATFFEPKENDPAARTVTIYGTGKINPNEAPPEVLLARLCALLASQPLCSDPLESAKFVQLVRTARALAPVPFFTTGEDFLQFLEGGGGPSGLYGMLRSLLGQDNPLLFRPVAIPPELRPQLADSFLTAATVISVDSTGEVGKARVRVRAVINFHDRWSPPPPNAGRMPSLGIIQYYRID